MCFILGAVLTPPDPVSQFMIAVPLVILYEVGIWISAITVKRRERQIWGKEGAPGSK